MRTRAAGLAGAGESAAHRTAPALATLLLLPSAFARVATEVLRAARRG